MKKKFLSLPKLSKFLDECRKIFAKKEVENRVTNVAVSTNKPTNQEIGDVWFIETEREP